MKYLFLTLVILFFYYLVCAVIYSVKSGEFTAGLHLHLKNLAPQVDEDDFHDFVFKVMKIMKQEGKYPKFTLNPAKIQPSLKFPTDEELLVIISKTGY